MIGGYFSVDDIIAPFSSSKPVASKNEYPKKLCEN
jgi:hypothetical protein